MFRFLTVSDESSTRRYFALTRYPNIRSEMGMPFRGIPWDLTEAPSRRVPVGTRGIRE